MSEAPSVVFAGSSSMEPRSALPAALAAELGLRSSEWIALGRGGARLADWTRPELPSGLRAVVVLLTANDRRPTARAVRAVDAALRRSAPLVVWLPSPPYPTDSPVADRGPRMRRALADAGVAWVERAVRMEPRHWSPDGVHPTGTGYRAYARQVAPELARLLAPPAASAELARLLAPPGPPASSATP